MPTRVRHKFTSLKADGADPQMVGPSKWNDDHVILGTDTDDDAQAGELGEHKPAVFYAVAAGPSGLFADIATLELTKGDWDLTCLLEIGGAAGVTGMELGVSKGAAGNVFDDAALGDNYINPTPNGLTTQAFCIPGWRVKLNATKTIRLKLNLTYGGGPICFGRLSARRMR